MARPSPPRHHHQLDPLQSRTGVLGAVYILFATRELGLGAILLGLVFASGAVGALGGALLTAPLARRFGVGPSVTWAALPEGPRAFLAPLAAFARGGEPHPVPVIALLVIARLLSGLADPLFVVNVVSRRQASTPGYLQGRVNAGVRSVADGVIPIGAVVGGLLGQSIGLQRTLVVGAVLELVSVLWLWRSPLRQVRELPMAAP
jgi:MFS family permease